jgi:ribonuclease HI
MTDPSAQPYVEIYTDGACSPNPGIGGWGTILISPAHNNHRRELSGSEAESTNNRMELQAAIEGLRALKQPCRVRITTDSKYVCRAYQDGWIVNWKRNGWKTKAKKPVANVEQWQILDALVSQHTVEWEWVKGHANHPENERADALAVEARLALDRELKGR